MARFDYRRMLALLACLAAIPAMAQPPAAPPPQSGAATVPSVVAKPIETNTKSDGGLEFKPSDKDTLPPPTAPVVASPTVKENAPPAPQTTGPNLTPANPTGPRIIDDLPAAGPGPAGQQAGIPSRGQTGVKQGKAYVIGPLDVLEVGVWGDQKLSGMRDVGTDGMIMMPQIGPVLANGLTQVELAEAVKEKLRSIIVEPEVYVQVLRINSKKYSIIGGCGRSGEFPLIGEVTILDALANCGGFREFVNKSKIYVLRGTKQLKFNYNDVIKGKHMEQNIPLENGDRIVVPD